MNLSDYTGNVYYITSDKTHKLNHIAEKAHFKEIYRKAGLLKGDTLCIDVTGKKDVFFSILTAHEYGIIPVLYDSSVISLQSFFKSGGFPLLSEIITGGSTGKSKLKTMPDTFMVVYTSGSTGFPEGLLKSPASLISETDALRNILSETSSVISTVPLIHIYGYLFAFLMPLRFNLDIYLNDDFSISGLIKSVSKNNINTVVTNPVYIKLMNKTHKHDFTSVTFTSSTMPLAPEDAEHFMDKFSAELIQIYGSTETGGIGIRRDPKAPWQTFPNIKVSLDKDERLVADSPHIAEYRLEKGEVKKVAKPFTTEDYADITADGCFILKGRTSSFVKISGKRISLPNLELILKNEISEIKDIRITAEHNTKVRGEQIRIYVHSKVNINNKIKEILRNEFPGTTFDEEITYVEGFSVNQTGKILLI